MWGRRMSERAISFPFTIDAYGNVASSSTPDKIWDDRVVAVLGTLSGTRVQRKTFGLAPTATPFENRGSIRANMEATVETAFTTWLPALTLLAVEVTTEGDNDVVTVRYSLPNRDETTTSVTVGSLSLDGANPPFEDFA